MSIQTHAGDFCYFMDVVQIFQLHSTHEFCYNPEKGVILWDLYKTYFPSELI